ncbi:MAG: hypothetical protein JJ992_10575, partial [Planctomycetes bacterium]|nr:hypothetical protein [Planctomycetota bacterium]
MKSCLSLAAVVSLILSLPGIAAENGVLPIQRVEIGSQREFRINGQPFFPLMAWLQDPENFEAVKQCGMNTTAGYWQGSGGTADVVAYIQRIREAGLYGVLPFDPRLKDDPSLLGYIQDDEPDLPRQVSDAEVLPAEHLVVNRQTPLWKIVDGVTHTWSVLDPLADASITIRLQKPVTATSVAVWPTISKGLPVAKDVAFFGDGRELLVVTLEAKKGQQKFPLPEPATFRELKLTVRSTYPGDNQWGSIGEVEAFDADGKNVLLAPPRNEPRSQPEITLEKYRAIRAADPGRPVFLTFTGNFHPHFDKWSDEQRRRLYPAYIKAADVVGYDIYPIYGWNRPDWLHLVHEATGLLVEQSAPRPVYAWIETSRGGQWTGDLDRQHQVTPAHIRAEVWMSICQGATAIGYFTHIWKPSYSQFGVPDANRQALRSINAQITALAPAILAPKSPREVSISPDSDARMDVMAREYQGDIYLFAVNFDSRAVASDACLAVRALAEGRQITVVDENRTNASEAG